MDSQFCGDNKAICLLTMTESLIYMSIFLYQYKLMSSAWIDMKVKETYHTSYTLRYKFIWVLLVIVTLILEGVLNRCTPYVIMIPIGCQFIVYCTMMKILYDDNKYFNQSRKQFRRFVRYPFLFQILQTLNMILFGNTVWINLIQIFLLFSFYEYLVDKSCNLQVKDLRKHIDNCEKLNIICNSNINLNQHMNNKQFLDDSPNLQHTLLQQSNVVRDTPQFDNFGTDIESDSGNEDHSIRVSFSKKSEIGNISINNLDNEKYEINYQYKEKQKHKIVEVSEMNKFMQLLNLSDFSQIWNDQNRLNYFIQYLESKNHQIWCENFSRQEIIDTFMPKSSQ
ncbi:unnamed protein product [Paramecium octaurelia]|uniref:Transmembrane protein n=1 Tax=Paramecium octaurelia TaxID=43137 RepID=A0A8S1S9S5_PAROT|nr:unnamed protein product [Paramecium octaurelia]